MRYPFEGDWILIPELARCDEGARPVSGRHRIRVEGQTLSIRMEWKDAAGRAHELALTGPVHCSALGPPDLPARSAR